MSRRLARRGAQLGRAVGAVAGVAVAVILLRALGPGEVMAHLERLGPGFALVPLAYLLAMAVYAVPFGLLLPKGLRPSAWALFVGRLASTSVNASTPLLGMGGEPARLLWLPPGRPAAVHFYATSYCRKRMIRQARCAGTLARFAAGWAAKRLWWTPAWFSLTEWLYGWTVSSSGAYSIVRWTIWRKTNSRLPSISIVVNFSKR